MRAIQKDGLLWGGSKLVAVGYGIKKLQITAVIEDAKVRVHQSLAAAIPVMRTAPVALATSAAPLVCTSMSGCTSSCGPVLRSMFWHILTTSATAENDNGREIPVDSID